MPLALQSEPERDRTPVHPAHAASSSAAHQPASPVPSGHGAMTPGTASAGARGLGASGDSGPRLNPLWNHLFGGPGAEAGDGRPLSQNHIGTQNGRTPVREGGLFSNAMHDTPYLGDYWEALSVTHDSRHIQNDLLNGASAVTNVGLAGPLMGLVDAPFRAFGHSLFLDQQHK